MSVGRISGYLGWASLLEDCQQTAENPCQMQLLICIRICHASHRCERELASCRE